MIGIAWERSRNVSESLPESGRRRYSLHYPGSPVGCIAAARRSP
jgi:hypothetical protein